jgi:hypothetical protein
VIMRMVGCLQVVAEKGPREGASTVNS